MVNFRKETKGLMRRILLGVIFTLFIGFFVYWFKCQQEIDLVKSLHLGNYLPVQVLQKNTNNVVFAEQQQDLLHDSFDSWKSADNWGKLWMRDEGKVTLGYDSVGVNDSRCLLITSKSNSDWSYQHNSLIEVKKREIFSFEGLVKFQGKNANAILGVIVFGPDKQVLKWYYADERIVGTTEWQKISRRFMIPEGVKYIRFRLSGSGVGKAWFDDVQFNKEESQVKGIDALKPQYVLENSFLKYTLDIFSMSIVVFDKRSNKEWSSQVCGNDFLAQEVIEEKGKLNVRFISPEALNQYRVVINLSQDGTEINYEIEQEGVEEFNSLEFPPVFDIGKAQKLIVPLQEGLVLPPDTAANDLPYKLAYLGNLLSMSFISAVDGEAGWMEIFETPNDFEIIPEKKDDGRLRLINRWISEKNKFGYKRKIKFYFFDKGGYCAQAKRYREYAREKGLLKRLKEKNRKGNIEKLIGGVDVWYWEKDRFGFANELKKSGVEKVLFSTADERSTAKINTLDFLTSRYDIYQDVWPEIYHNVTSIHEGWPEDLVLDKKGDWVKGWVIKQGLKEYPGGVICSSRGLLRAKESISKELKTIPYSARLIDTVTASAWVECYNPKHPITRNEDIEYKMGILKISSEDAGLVTGSENGVDCAVSYADYFEGMMSPGIGRLPGSGRDVAAVKYINPTDNFLRYGVGEKYRLPLWQLVYGDCVVATWYWDDANNRIPEVWWRKDLSNILYGNMPLWAIRDYNHWKQYKKRFIESYNNVCPVFEKVGFLEMLSHRFVTEDRVVQETMFEGDIRVLVNFGEETFELDALKYSLPAHGFVVFEKDKVWKKGVCN